MESQTFIVRGRNVDRMWVAKTYRRRHLRLRMCECWWNSKGSVCGPVQFCCELVLL